MHTLAQLAELLGASFEGNPETKITGARPFSDARSGDLTLAGSAALLPLIADSKAAAICVPVGTAGGEKGLLLGENPKLLFAQALALIYPRHFEASGVSDQAVVDSTARVSSAVAIGPFVHIEPGVVIDDGVSIQSGARIGAGSRIGSGSTIHANVSLYRETIVGSRVSIHSGTVIGADGFGYVWDGNQHVRFPQNGRVEIGDDVEIGANCCIDRATFGATVIESDVKIDNLVHIGHNCRIGQSTIIIGCVGISGSVEIGRGCIISGQTGFVDHVRVGDNVKIMGDTVVTRDVPSNATISGRFGRPHREELKIEALRRKLPELYRDLQRLRGEVQSLKGQRGVQEDE